MPQEHLSQKNDSSHFFPNGIPKKIRRSTTPPQCRLPVLTNKRLHTSNLSRKTQKFTAIFDLIPWQIPDIQKGIHLSTLYQINTLIVGETGAGKDLVAQAIHKQRLGDHNINEENAPYVAINCGSIPANLAESILFGHERGAFTSARERQIGKFEKAQEGTLFLDEIQSLPEELQVKLLRVLQTGHYERLGSSTTLKVNCHIIAASNVPLEILVEKKLFRRDLFYRLNVCPIYLPALRERKTEFSKLVDVLLQKTSQEHGIPLRSLSTDTHKILKEHSWPGNLRELEHCLLFSSLRSEDHLIETHSLPPHLTGKLANFINNGDWL